MSRPAARLWFGRTTHRREKPFVRSFSHRVAMLDIDIDRLDDASRLSRLLSINRPNLIAFHTADHGSRRKGAPLRPWAERLFAEAGVSLSGGPIRLLTFPRVLGYGFAPISLWQGFGPDGRLRGVIYEVHNTFGETHAYVSAPDPASAPQHAAKEFFVSPFFDIVGDYRFSLRHADHAIALTVENLSPDGRHHVAGLRLSPRHLTSGQVLKWLIAMPISGLGVMIAIHWQALRLWLKGARYRDKPEQRARRTSLARTEKMPGGAQAEPRKRA